MLLGDTEEPFRLVGEAWTQQKPTVTTCDHVIIVADHILKKQKKRTSPAMCLKFSYTLFPHLRDVDHDIAVGHISHPNESLLNDPLALDLDIGHRSPGSQQKRRGA